MPRYMTDLVQPVTIELGYIKMSFFKKKKKKN